MESILAEHMKSLLREGPGYGARNFESVESALADKNAIIADFKSIRKMSKKGGSKMFQMHLSAMGGLSRRHCPWKTCAPLASGKIHKELRIGRPNKGLFLRGKLVETPFRMTVVVTLLEDEDGLIVNLVICGSVMREMESVEAMYPRGTRVAVKEPHLIVTPDGRRLVLRVDNPRDVVVMDNPLDGPVSKGPKEGGGAGAPTAAAKARTDGLAGVDALREEGNRFFAAGKWEMACQRYDKCLEEIEAVKVDDPAAVAELRVAAHSNRAEACLRLGMYEDALRDACRALECDDKHVKSLYRKAKALCGLHCYREAVQFLQKLVKPKTSPVPKSDRAMLQSLLEDALVGERQKAVGDYKLDDHFLALFTLHSDKTPVVPVAPRCSDYVGSVEIRKVVAKGGGAGPGRGLFATKPVKAGELLLVSNPVAVAQAAGDETFEVAVHPARSGHSDFLKSVNEDLVTLLLERASRSPRTLRQLYSLSDGTAMSAEEVPPMDLFAPKDSGQLLPYTAPSQAPDVARIRRIVQVNSFRGSKGTGKLESVYPDVASSSGLWLLPSFINHSCLPNCTRTFVGDAMFVRAFQDIAAGEEITIVYTYIHQPLPQRREFFSKHSGFECGCRRCSFEEKLAQRFPVLKRINKDFAKLPARNDKNVHSVLAAGDKLAREVDNILKELPAEDAAKKSWIKASFMRAYMCTSAKYMKTAVESRGIRDWDIWTESMLATLQTMICVSPTEELLSQMTRALFHVPFPDSWQYKWKKLASKVCTSLHGPMQKLTIEGLLLQSSKTYLPL